MSGINFVLPYIGVAVSLLLAIGCNVQYDARYGTVGFELTVWGTAIAAALGTAWLLRQVPPNHKVLAAARAALLVVALGLFLVLFRPLWGMPRAGAYFLAAVTVALLVGPLTLLRLYFTAVAATVLVLFSASHPRAGWGLLTYAAPFIAAQLYTLLAAQAAHRFQAQQQNSLSQLKPAGLAVGALVAFSVIMGLSFLLYLMLPHPNLLNLVASWADGGGLGHTGSAGGGVGSGAAGGGGETGGSGGSLSAGTLLLGMLFNLAGVLEALGTLLRDGVMRLVEVIRVVVAYVTLDLRWLVLLLLLGLVYWLLHRYRVGAWVAAYARYFWLVHLDGAAPRTRALSMYRASMSVLALRGYQRGAGEAPRFYWRRVKAIRPELETGLAAVTVAHEQAAYSEQVPTRETVAAALTGYRVLFKTLAPL